MQQNNFGSGPFVAGHNFGNIEMVDDRTRAALAKISRDLPPVGALLSKALDEGLIPPETVRTLAGVAQNINADVARAIWEGGRNINEDTASWILQGGRNINEDTASWIAQAGRNINEDVANSLAHTAEELKRAAERFERILQQMRDASGTLRSSKANAGEWNRTAAAMKRAADDLAMATQVQAEAQGTFSARWFGNGVITGFAAAIALAVLVVVIQINAT
ncbi:hypothetical protein HCB17_25260 [Salinispora arenicola]|uniref:hypothetical protein n=1 Tax=Salinispora arenicola TaxID=168697 RepID=UPI0014301D69|nr:hypothetical protein [Salinispora arenicola]NIL44049.1 hypothetical protein [Salinispora arenicola]